MTPREASARPAAWIWHRDAPVMASAPPSRRQPLARSTPLSDSRTVRRMSLRAPPAPPATLALFGRAYIGRIVALWLPLVIFVVLLATDRAAWKVGLAGVCLVAYVVLTTFGLWRIRRAPRSLRVLQVDLVVTILLMGMFIYLTGGIESPLLVGFAVVGFVCGF